MLNCSYANLVAHGRWLGRTVVLARSQAVAVVELESRASARQEGAHRAL